MNQLKHDMTLGYKEESTGTIYYKAGPEGSERVLIEYTAPTPQTVSVIGSKVVIYQPQINQAFVTTRQAQAGKNRSLAVVGMGYGQAGAALRDRYDVTLLGPDKVNGLETTLLALKPKQSENGIVAIQLWVDNVTWLPVKYVVQEKGAKTTTTLSGVKKDLKLDDSRFEIKLPKGTKVVEG
jgi:outer membrane lipoprotein-sorting protein